MVKSYLKYHPGPDSGTICGTVATSMQIMMMQQQQRSNQRSASAAASQNQELAATPSMEYIALWSLRTGESVARLIPPEEAKKEKRAEVSTILLRADIGVLAAGYNNGFVSFWRLMNPSDPLSWACSFYGQSHKPRSIVLSLAVSNDGTFLFSGGQDTDVTVWDTTAREPQYRLRGHRGAVVGVVAVDTANKAADESTEATATESHRQQQQQTRCLVTGGADGLIKVWRLDIQQCVQTIVASDTQVTALVADASCSRIIVGMRDEVVKVYRVKADASAKDDLLEPFGVLKRKTSKAITALCFSQDWTLLAAVTDHTVEFYHVLSEDDVKRKVQRKRKRRRDQRKQQNSNQPKKAKNREDDVAVHEDAREDGEDEEGSDVEVTAAEEFIPLRFYGFESKVRALRFLKSSTQKNTAAALAQETPNVRVAVSFSQNEIAVYEVQSHLHDDNSASLQPQEMLGDMKRVTTIDSIAHSNGVKTLAFTSDEMHLVSGSSERCKLWTVTAVGSHTLALGLNQRRGGQGQRHLLLNMDEDRWADAQEANQDDDLRGLDAGDYYAQLHRDTMMACAGTIDVAREMSKRSLLAADDDEGSKKEKDLGVTRLLVLPGDDLLLLGTSDGKLLIARKSSCDVERTIPGHVGPVTGLCHRPDQSGVVSCGYDRRIVVWEYALVEVAEEDENDDESSKPAKKQIKGKRPTEQEDAPPRRKRRELQLNVTQEVELTQQPLFVKCTPDNKMIGVALQDNSVQLFYSDSMKPFVSLYNHKLPCTAIAFSDDSELCATVSMDKSLRFWGLDFGDCHRSIHAHDDYVTDVSFVAKTHHVVTCSKDATVKYWDGDDWTLVQVFKIHHGPILALCVSNDGTCIATAGEDRCVRLLFRTEEMLFPAEEEDRRNQEALEEEQSKRIALQRLDEIETGDVGVAGQRSIATADAGEEIMSALDHISVELQRQARDRAEGTDTSAEALPYFRKGRSVWKYLWSVLEAVRPSETRHALSSLTSIHVVSLVRYLLEAVRHKAVTNYETAARFLLAIVKPAPGVNTAPILTFDSNNNQNQMKVAGLENQEDLVQVMSQLRRLISEGLSKDVQRVSKNVAGLGFVKHMMEQEERVKFTDYSAIQGAKKKWHNKSLD